MVAVLIGCSSSLSCDWLMQHSLSSSFIPIKIIDHISELNLSNQTEGFELCPSELPVWKQKCGALLPPCVRSQNCTSHFLHSINFIRRKMCKKQDEMWSKAGSSFSWIYFNYMFMYSLTKVLQWIHVSLWPFQFHELSFFSRSQS